MKDKSVRIMAVMIALGLGILACGGSAVSSGEVISTNTPAAQVTYADVKAYKVGDVIQTTGQVVTLNSAEFVGSVLVANLTIENNGTNSISVGPFLYFEARDAHGSKMELETFDCPSGNLQSKIVPGDKLRGYICWKGLTTDTARIYYTPDLFGATILVWDVEK